MIEEDFEGSVRDAGLIGAAQRVEHYEIAGYGTVKAFAETLGETEHVSLIEQTLQEEKETDEKLTELAEQINSQATSEAEQGEGEDARSSKKLTTAGKSKKRVA